MISLLLKLLLVLVLGFLVGLERQKKHKAIGVRSTTLTILGAFIFAYMGTLIGGDPARIIAQIVTGVGFIGGGIMFKSSDKEQVSNLTTAILIWVLSAIGCLIALNFWLHAIIITLIVMIILYVYEYIINKRNEKK